MAITINGQERRIGLALSGGGFRAAAFHLGVMRKLQSLGLFSSVDLLSCVSGGSIAGAFVALHWGSATVLDELENYLATRSIAVSSVIGGILDPFESRLDKLAKTYDRDLFKGARLSVLAGLSIRIAHLHPHGCAQCCSTAAPKVVRWQGDSRVGRGVGWKIEVQAAKYAVGASVCGRCRRRCGGGCGSKPLHGQPLFIALDPTEALL